MRDTITLVARLALGIFFLQAALGKVVNLRDYLRGVVDYQILPAQVALVTGFVLPWVEVGLALALLAGAALLAAGGVAAMLLLCFTLAVAINLRRGRKIRCNCYGIAGTSSISLGTVVRNILLFLLAAAVVSSSGQGDQRFVPGHVHRISLTVQDGLLLLLAIACIVSILLVEWTIDIYARVSARRSLGRWLR